MAGKLTDIEIIAQAAEKAADAIRLHASSPECFASDRTAVLGAAVGWDAFADALRASVPTAA